MKVCFVVGKMNFSGAEKVLSIIANSLAQKGHDVHVMLLQKENGYCEKENQITIHGVKPHGNRIKRIYTRFFNIRHCAKSINPDVIVSFGYVCNNNTILSLLGSPFPVIVCERNDPNYDPDDRFQRLIRKLVYRFAKGYVFQTKRIAECFSKHIQNKAAIIPNPITQSEYSWNEEVASNKIVTVARLDEYQKNIYMLIDAFEIFHQEHKEYTLDIYGDGPDEELYRQKIQQLHLEGIVNLHGRVNNPSSHIIQGKIFALSSIFEGMPNALMEAMSVGMPCISTNCGGGGAESLNEMTGGCMIVPVKDTNAFAAGLCKLVDDKSLRIELSNKAKKINQCLDVEKVIEEWSKYIQEITR